MAENLFYLINQKLTMEPLLISKVNTTAQFILVIFILGLKGFSIPNDLAIDLMIYIVSATTLASGAAYVGVWGLKASRIESGE